MADLHERPPPPVPWLRMILTGLFGLVVLMAGAAGLIRALIDTEAIHAEAQAALAEITGREVRIGGRLQVVSYFSATIAFDDIAIANRPGADVPDMVRIGRVEAELSLLALVSGRTEIQRLVISEPVITLEVDAEGRGNWQNQTAAADAPTMARAASRLPPNVHVKDGRLAFTDARSGRSTAITLRRVSLAEGGSGGLLTVAADLAYGAQRFSVNGQVGSWARLVDRTAAAPWPVRLTLETPGTKLTVAGGFTRPMDLAGYAVKVDLWVADSSTLSGVIPYRLPVMRTVSLTARVADNGGGFPDIAGARLQMGASDMSAWVPGLKLDTTEINIPALEQSARGEFRGTLNSVPVRMQASLGGLAALLPDRAETAGSFPVDIALELGESRLALKGSIAAIGARSGMQLVLTGRVRDLELLSPLVGTRLPELRNVELKAILADGDPTGFADRVAVRDLSLTMQHGDLGGSLVIGHTPRWALEGSLRGARMDIDALALALRPATGPIDLTERASPFRPRIWDDSRTISNAKLRLDPLRAADADLSVALDEMRLVGVTYRAVAARLRLTGGRLALDPFAGDLPGGRATVRLDIDAADPRTPMRLRASIPGVPVQPLLASSSRRDNLFGALEIDADLSAEGDSLRALAATVSGRLGLAIVEGDIDSRLLLDPLASVMGAARVPLNLATLMGTLARLRCFAMRLDADRGKTGVATMVLESGLVLIEGGGAFDLGSEELALRLRSSIRIPGQAVSVPSRLEGSFAEPSMALDPPDPARAPAAARPDADVCGPALELARAGRVGTAPAARDARPSLVAPNPVRPR